MAHRPEGEPSAVRRCPCRAMFGLERGWFRIMLCVVCVGGELGLRWRRGTHESDAGEVKEGGRRSGRGGRLAERANTKSITGAFHNAGDLLTLSVGGRPALVGTRARAAGRWALGKLAAESTAHPPTAHQMEPLPACLFLSLATASPPYLLPRSRVQLRVPNRTYLPPWHRDRDGARESARQPQGARVRVCSRSTRWMASWQYTQADSGEHIRGREARQEETRCLGRVPALLAPRLRLLVPGHTRGRATHTLATHTRVALSVRGPARRAHVRPSLHTGAHRRRGPRSRPPRPGTARRTTQTRNACVESSSSHPSTASRGAHSVPSPSAPRPARSRTASPQSPGSAPWPPRRALQRSPTRPSSPRSRPRARRRSTRSLPRPTRNCSPSDSSSPSSAAGCGSSDSGEGTRGTPRPRPARSAGRPPSTASSRPKRPPTRRPLRSPTT